MATHHFDDELTARLEQLASQAGAASVEAYLRMLLGLDLPVQTPMTPEEFESELDKLVDFDGPSIKLPYSREDIYFDHD